MSKSKNKGKKPQQNENKSKEELEIKAEETIDAADEVTDEEVAEEAEEIVEDAAEEAESDVIEESGEEAESDESGEEEEEEPKKAPRKKIELNVPTEESRANEEFRKLHFIEKCKKDPIIPVCIILAILALIVAGIYFMLPNAKTPSMGMTLSEFQTRFNDGAVAQSLLNNGLDFSFRMPEYVDSTSHPSVLGDKAVFTANRAYADFFDGPFKYYSYGGVEGATRKSDGNLSYVRVYVNYGEEEFNTVWLYASNVICALYPDLTMYPAMDVAMKAMKEYDGDARFYVRGDYAFRLVAVKKAADGGGEIVYIVVDCVPKSILNESQIRENQTRCSRQRRLNQLRRHLQQLRKIRSVYSSIYKTPAKTYS